MKGAERHMKIILVVFRERISFGEFDLFRPFFTVSDHCYYWILKRSGHFFHDYYWILKQSGYDSFHDYYWILKQSGHD